MKKILLAIVFLLYLNSKQVSAQNAAVGSGHFHVVCSDGSVQGWGANTEGELGNGSFSNSNTPVPANSLTGIISVAAGSRSSIALKSDGTVWTCGGNLGTGSPNNSNIPVQVPSLTGIVAVAAAPDRSFALKNDGTVWGWGTNSVGALGNGTTVSSDYPVQASISNVIAIAAGVFYTLALKNDGTVWAWGYNAYGQLGNGTLNDSYVPVQVTSLSNIIAISAFDHSFALKNDGSVWAWGDNAYGQLGDGTINSTGCHCKFIPTQISITNVRSIAAGGGHSLALLNDGTVWTWGYNWAGQLGNGSNTNTATPAMLSSISGVTSINAAYWSSMALKSDGTAWTWGEYGNPNTTNTTMTGDTTNHPMIINGLCQTATNLKDFSSKETNIEVFPNPTTKVITINIISSNDQEQFLLIVRNSLGKTVYTEDLKEIPGSFTKQVDLSYLAKGIYFVELQPTVAGSSHKGKVTKLILQ